MTDIVERLREYARMDNRPSSAWMREAAVEIERLRADVKFWNADARRLSSGLLAIHLAPADVPASVLKSAAYDIALNCMDGKTAAYQIERRALEGK